MPSRRLYSRDVFDLGQFFNLSHDMLCIASMDGYFQLVNRAFEDTLGYSSDELLAKPFLEFVHPDDIEPTLREMENLAGGAPTLAFENRYRCADGNYKRLRWIAYPKAEEALIYAVARDMSERDRLIDRLRNISPVDGLTGLATRQIFENQLKKEWHREQRFHQPLTIALVDADEFGAYNSEHGHTAGDEAIRAIASTLRRNFHNAGDLAARTAGDKFGLILPGTDAGSVAADAERVRDEIERLDIPHPLEKNAPRVTVSIGIASAIPADGMQAQELLQRAEEAVKTAKDLGRNQVVVNEPAQSGATDAS